ncbi:MAG: Crp/Fnr family transcriptional regulator [Acidiferrobacterales bacterium]
MKDMLKLFGELRRAPLFAQVDDTQLATLANIMQQVELAPGEMLFTHGQTAERFFFVRSGRVKLFRLSPEGQEKIIEVVEPGQTFAEAVMFMGTQGHYPVNAQSMNDTRLYAFDQKQFLKVLSESPEICLGMLSAMSRRLHRLINQIDSLTLQNATYRLAMYLLEHAPQGLAEATEIELTTPKGMIASQLAIQPETFSRILAKFRRLGLIEVNGNHIALRNLRGLRHLAYAPAPDDGV